MTDKEKIAQIIAEHLCSQGKSHKRLYGAKRMCYSRDNFAECEKVSKCVDALIAAGVKFDPIPEREYQGQLAVVYRALFNMTNKYCDAERKIATTKDGWFSCGAVQLALLAREAISDAEKELAEEKKDDERPKKND